MKLKLNKSFVVLFSVLSLFLYSCSDDDSQNLTVEKEIKYQKISLKEIRNKAGKNKSFSNVLQAVDDFKKKNSTNSRELDMNDYYVDENTGSYIESDGTQTYTFPVYDLTTESQNIENLVITLDIKGEYSYAIVEYGLTQDEFNQNLTSEQATPISITSRVTVEVCKILMCYNHGNGTAGVSHIAGANCVNPAFLFYVYVYYSPSSGSGGTGTGGTGGTGTGTGDNTGGTGTGTSGTGSNTTGGGGVVTTPVQGTLSQKQLSFLRELGFSGENFMGMDYSAITPVLNYINNATNPQINTVLYFFKNQISYIWMYDQSAQSQASICNYLIVNNFSLNSINYLNQMINIAATNGLSVKFDSTLNASNSLSFNSVSEIQNYFDSTVGTNQAEISYEQENTNEKIAVAKLDVSTLYDLNIKVKQKMSPYSVMNVTSNISGMIYGIKWEQKDYSVRINGNVATVVVYGTISASIIQGGIGTFWTKDKYYTLEIDILTGEIFGTIIH